MIGEADEVTGNPQNQSPQKMSVLCEVPAVQNTEGEVDNGIVNVKDQNANLPPSEEEQNMEESEEDEPIIRTKSHKKASRHILEDSDSEQEDSGISATKPPHSQSSNDSPAGSDTEDKENVPTPAAKKKRVISRLDSDSDGEAGVAGSDTEDKGKLPTSETKKKRVMSRLDSDSDSDGSEDEAIPLHPKPKAASDSDDSGNEDGSNKASDRNSDSDDSNRSNADSDDDDDPPMLTEELKKKLAKGAAKKGKKQSYSRKAKTDAITEIHAETQRLVREAEVRLPYHNPRPLGLSAILARAQQKQEHLSNMKRAWKTPPPTTVCADGKESLISRATAQLAAKTGTSPTLTKPDTNKEGKTGASPALSKPETTTEGDETQDMTVPPLDLEDTGETGKDDASKDDASKDDVCASNPPQTAVSMEEEDDDELPDITPTNQTTPQAAVKGDNADIQNEQRAQDKTPEVVMAQDKEQTKREEQDEIVEETSLLSKSPLAKTPLVSKTPVSKTPRSRTMLTPKLANLDVKPRLSGGPDTFIDLDFDEPDTTTPKPGVLDLMDRLVKHSAPRLKKAAKDVEVSTVEKVQVEGEREELQLKKMTVHLSGDQEPGPAGDKPGAKLTSLKLTLAQKMKEKREEARQARYQIYALDNEEGFMGDEEEEAELTDGEDTDDEPEEEPEEEEEEEEDMDDDGYTTTEKANKIANPFLDDEAEDDDDDGDAGLHLALDAEEDDTQQSTQSAQSTSTQPPPVEPKAFLKAALQKTNTLQLFDDDAISESPTLSQQSNKENIAVSERPFEQLSGETLKAAGGDTDMEDTDDVNTLHMDVDDDITTQKTAHRPHLLREVSVSSADNSFDQIPAGQGTGGKKNRFRERQGTPDVFTPSSKSSLGAKSLSKMSDLALPIEDSQDLMDSPLHLSQSTPRNFAGLDDSNTESQSRLLDDDGLLKPKSSGSKIRRQLNLGNTSANEDTDDQEILGLCSGQFTTQTNKNSDEILGLCSGQFTTQTNKNSDEILGLCSGQFTTQTNKNSDEILGLCSGQFTTQTNKNSDEILGLCSGQFTTQSGKNDDELLGLCSGQFTTQPASRSASKPSFGGVDGLSQLMTGTQAGSQDDLLALCSGQFSGTSAPTSAAAASSPPGVGGSPPGVGGSFGFKMSGLKSAGGTQGGNLDNKKDDSPVRVRKVKVKKQRRRIRVHESDDEGDDFEVASGGNAADDMEQEDLDSDEELGLQLDDGSDDEEVQLARAEKHKPMKMANFVEAEAELSGSEYDSDENYDIDAKDDVLEACSGDEDELPSDDELRDQVGRVHMKTLIDEDKRELRLMQEMYLPDGDLYSEGQGRTRRFRWKNVDDDTQQDMFQESDEEKEDENIEAQKWRLERHEREKFLSEQQQEQGGEAEHAGSQVLKLGKVVFKPKKAQLTKQTTVPVVETEEKKTKEKEPKSIFKVPKLSCGSFLSRGKDTLAKIAEMTKPMSTNINGPRHSRGLLFTSMSKDEDEEDTKKPPAVRRSLSNPPPNQPASKKPRLEKSQTLPATKKSIFDHL